MAADLVRRQVAVIAATSTPAAVAAKAATTTIPIVFETGGNPIQIGLVTSLSRPGGNVTGVTSSNVEVAPKRLELLHELLPTVRVMALLVDPTDPTTAKITVSEVLAAARTFGLQLHVLNASSESDFNGVFAKLIQLGAGGLVVGGGAFFISHREQLAALSVRHAMPVAFEHREFTAAGGLLSYGSDIRESYRLTGIYTGRILKGDKPAELPVRKPPRSSCSSTSRPPRRFGFNVPNTLMGACRRGDRMMERREFITILGGAAAPLRHGRSSRRCRWSGSWNGASFEDLMHLGGHRISTRPRRDGLYRRTEPNDRVPGSGGSLRKAAGLGRDLARLQVAVIVAIGGSNSALAAKAMYLDNPYRIRDGRDAVELGLVKSLNRPEANLTGMKLTTSQVGAEASGPTT